MGAKMIFRKKSEEEKLLERKKEFKERLELAEKILKKNKNPPKEFIVWFLIFSELREIIHLCET